MKRTILLLVLLFVTIVTSNSYANVYASGLKFSDDTVSVYENADNTWDGNFANGGVKIWFVINESGVGSLSGAVYIKNSTGVVRILQMAGLTKGVNSIVWDGFANNGSGAPVGNYWFEVFVQDPVGHTSFDSIWVAGAYYQGNDFDGGTSYAYRGNASVLEQSSPFFGNIYVARGTTSANGIYELRGDGVYQRKLGTAPNWPSSTPNEIAAVGNRLYGSAGYGFVGGGFLRSFDSETNTFLDSAMWGTIQVRGLFTKIVGTDTIFITTRSGAGLNPAIIKKVGMYGDTTTLINLRPYILGNGYTKQALLDDEDNVYVLFGELSASRKKIAKFNANGDLIKLDSLDGVAYGGLTGAYFQSLAIDRGTNFSSTADDKLYALIYGGSTASPNNGIYSIPLDIASVTKKITPVGVTSAATSQIINVDPAGNVVWSNGASSERIVVFSPEAGPNSFTTVSPAGMHIVVTNPVPVELASFSASTNGKQITLSWTTVTETNNSGFEVERATILNGFKSEFAKTSFVRGNGTTTQLSSYSYSEIPGKGSFVYRLKQIDFDGKFSYSAEVNVDLGLPTEFTLSQNYPNPFNPSTSIRFTVPEVSNVKLEVFSLTGELISTLVNEVKEVGSYDVSFDASKLSSGIYLYKLTAGKNIITKKMSFLK